VSTAIHRRVKSLQAGLDPTHIARLPSGWLVLGDPQVFEGYCLLLPDPVVPDLNALSGDARAQFLSDMAACGDVLMAEFKAIRMNYAMYGNVEPALHAHLFPRRHDEPDDQATAQPWALDWTCATRFSAERHGAIIDRIRQGILSRIVGAT